MAELNYEVRRSVAYLELNRPERRNALNQDLVRSLREALDRAQQDKSVRVLVLTGAGTAFSSGADLKELQAMQSASIHDNRRDSAALAALFKKMVSLPKPIVARINGHAIGGGCGLAVASDLSIVAESARLGFTEVRIGFVPSIVAGFVLRRVGEAVCRELLLTGTVITATEAARIGLVTRAVPDEKLDEAVDQVVSAMVRETSGTAIALTKRLLRSLPGMSVSEALRNGASLNAIARGTPECRAGIAAFLNKEAFPWQKAADEVSPRNS
ncbi:MAG TPA: enoyl-CoA hydratase-related protein [Rhodothermales bacterium]